MLATVSRHMLDETKAGVNSGTAGAVCTDVWEELEESE